MMGACKDCNGNTQPDPTLECLTCEGTGFEPENTTPEGLTQMRKVAAAFDAMLKEKDDG